MPNHKDTHGYPIGIWRTALRKARDCRRKAVKRGASLSGRHMAETEDHYLPALTKLEVERLRLEKETGVVHQMDHILPCSLGGKHWPKNLQILSERVHKLKTFYDWKMIRQYKAKGELPRSRRDTHGYLSAYALWLESAASEKMPSAQANRREDTSSQHQGVYWCNFTGAWVATIPVDGEIVYVGSYDCEEQAAAAYKDFAMRCGFLYGELRDCGHALESIAA